MGMSCLNCAEDLCPSQGLDMPACEDHTAIGDAEPKRIDPVENLLAGLRSDVDDLSAQFKSLQRQVDDFFAAVVKLREGEDS